MSTLLTLFRKDVANFTRDKTALSLTFLVPVVLIYIFGHVFGINRAQQGPTGIPLAVVVQSDNPAARKLLTALQNEKTFRVLTQRILPDKTKRPLTEEDLRPAMRANDFRFAVVIPADVIREDSIGIRLKIYSNPRNEIETQTVNGMLQKTLFSSVPELLGQSLQAQAKKALGSAKFNQFNTAMAETIGTTFDVDADAVRRGMEKGDFGFSAFTKPAGASAANDGSSAESTNTSAAANAFANLMKIETVQVSGAEVKNPGATRMVGGWAVMFLLFALSGSAAAFFDEKKTGIFQRLLAAPVSRGHLLWSRFIFGIALGVVQLTTLFFAGRLLYGIDVFGNFGNLLAICAAAAAACTAFGMLVAAIAPSPAAASGLATFLVLTMSATGGAWFPVSIMPEFMQTIAKFTIVYWSIEGFAQVLWAGMSFTEILPTLGLLLAIAAGVMGLAVWRFSKRRLFD